MNDERSEPDATQTPAGVIRAAGGLIVRGIQPGVSRIAVIHRPRYDDWSFPKGKANEGESDQATALREVEEETGLRCELGALLPQAHYLDSLGRPKVVTYWTMTALGGTFAPSAEVDQIRWVSFEEAERLLSYEHDRQLLRTLREFLPKGHPLYLVRHAKAGDRTKWTEDDRLRPLTKNGRMQAEQLELAFRDRAVGAIVSSPYVRCVQTVRPLALAKGLTIVTDEALAEGASLAVVLALIDKVSGTPAVLCSHGDVIPMIVEHLRHEGVKLAGGSKWKKGSVWALERAADGSINAGGYEPTVTD
jgi:8-oxo-(d)GTP phosphatase